MTSKTNSPNPERESRLLTKEDRVRANPSQRVLMPREYYDIKHPWFGSQIHYTIDVFRQLIRDAKASKQNSPKDDN